MPFAATRVVVPSTVTDAPSSEAAASDATFAPPLTETASVAVAERLSLATSCAPSTVTFAVLLSAPTETVELPPTNAFPETSTSPPSASSVAAPLAASAVPSPVTVTPPAFASTSTVPDAPTCAAFFTTTALAVLIFKLPTAAPSGIVTAPVSRSTVNVPALTVAPSTTTSPFSASIVTSPFFAMIGFSTLTAVAPGSPVTLIVTSFAVMPSTGSPPS